MHVKRERKKRMSGVYCVESGVAHGRVFEKRLWQSCLYLAISILVVAPLTGLSLPSLIGLFPISLALISELVMRSWWYKCEI